MDLFEQNKSKTLCTRACVSVLSKHTKKNKLKVTFAATHESNKGGKNIKEITASTVTIRCMLTHSSRSSSIIAPILRQNIKKNK